MRLSLLVGVLLFVSPALAAEAGLDASAAPTEPETVEAQPCRPTIACMAELVPAGFFEVEAGYGGRQSAGTFVSSGQLLLKYSVLDNLQVQLATNNAFLAGPGLAPRAFDGVMPGLKWKLNSQGDKVPSNALSVHLLLPTHGFAEAAQKTVDLQAWWYLSKDLSIVHADLNLMLNVADLGGRPTPQGLAALAVSVALPRGFGLFTELYSSFGNAGALPLDGGSLNGLSYSPIDEIVFDAGVDVGFFPGTRSFSVFAGVTFVPHGRSRVPLARATGAGASGLLAAR
jgi:hypothetical protein